MSENDKINLNLSILIRKTEATATTWCIDVIMPGYPTTTLGPYSSREQAQALMPGVAEKVRAAIADSGCQLVAEEAVFA